MNRYNRSSTAGTKRPAINTPKNNPIEIRVVYSPDQNRPQRHLFAGSRLVYQSLASRLMATIWKLELLVKSTTATRDSFEKGDYIVDNAHSGYSV